MHEVDGAPGLLLYRGVDDAASDTINEEDANEGALMVDIGALCHHSQQVGVQTLRRETTMTSFRNQHSMSWLPCEPWGPEDSMELSSLVDEPTLLPVRFLSSALALYTLRTGASEYLVCLLSLFKTYIAAIFPPSSQGGL